MKKIITISLLTFLLFSCDNKFPDYVKKDNDIYMKLLSFDDIEHKINKKGFARASIQILDKDVLLYKRYKENIITLENNKFTFLLQYLNIGDSMSFKVPTEQIVEIFKPIFVTKTTSNYLEVTIKVYDYNTQLEYDREMEEQLVLKKYLEDVKATFYDGIYIKKLKRGIGEIIKQGDIVTISYKGKFVNRLMFDEISEETAFTFTYGMQGQVIKGLEIAINTMREGDKSKIIIPSQLAFGEEGSTTSIIPPYTTVVYDLEIIKVQ